MADSSWLSIFGAVTGAIGALSGSIGALLGYRGYRRAQDVKALDLRLKLRKDVSDARALVARLQNLLPEARKSREGALAAAGIVGGRRWDLWLQELNADLGTVGSLHLELHRSHNDHGATTDHAQLESSLVSIHRFTGRANQLREKYEGELKKDDRLRDRRSPHRAAWLPDTH